MIFKSENGRVSGLHARNLRKKKKKTKERKKKETRVSVYVLALDSVVGEWGQMEHENKTCKGTWYYSYDFCLLYCSETIGEEITSKRENITETPQSNEV